MEPPPVPSVKSEMSVIRCNVDRVNQLNKHKEILADIHVHPTLDVQSRRPIIKINDRKSINNLQRIVQSRMKGTMARLPICLNGTKRYPGQWNHNCWWCCHPFKTRPVGCPVRYTQKTNTFHLKGFFCSYNCAKAWGHLYLSQKERDCIGIHILGIVMKTARANKVKFDVDAFKSQSKMAPDKSTLKSFGGCLTIGQFRTQYCKQTQLIVVPQASGIQFIPLGYNLYEVDKLPSQSSKQPRRIHKEKNVNKSIKRKRGSQSCSNPVKKRSIYSMTQEFKNTQSMERLAMQKRNTTVRSSQTSIGSMMNLKFN